MFAIHRIGWLVRFQASNIMQAVLWSFFPLRLPHAKKMPIIRIMLNAFQRTSHPFFAINCPPLSHSFPSAEYGTASRNMGVLQDRLRVTHLQGFASPEQACSGAPALPLHMCAPKPADPEKTPIFL